MSGVQRAPVGPSTGGFTPNNPPPTAPVNIHQVPDPTIGLDPQMPTTSRQPGNPLVAEAMPPPTIPGLRPPQPAPQPINPYAMIFGQLLNMQNRPRPGIANVK